MNFKKLYDDYLEFLDQVKAGAKSTKLDSIFSDLTQENIHFKKGPNYGDEWFRARSHHSPQEEPWIRDQIGMNKTNPSQGRCNKEGESLLYLSKSRDTTFMEIESKIGDIVSVGHFIFQEAKKVIDLTGVVYSKGNVKYGGYTASEARYFLILIIHNCFKAQNDGNIYQITNYVSKLFIKAGIDGILYNSICDKKGQNLALSSEMGVKWEQTEQFIITNIIKSECKCESRLLKTIYCDKNTRATARVLFILVSEVPQQAGAARVCSRPEALVQGDGCILRLSAPRTLESPARR